MCCEFHNYCRHINLIGRSERFCLKLIIKCLDDYSWKERINYKFIPHKERWDKTESTLQLKDPWHYFDIEICSEENNLFLPISLWEKPLVQNVDISVFQGGLERKTEIPNRIESSYAMSLVLLSQLKFLKQFNRIAHRIGIPIFYIVSFVNAFISFSGEIKTCKKKSKSENEIRKEIFSISEKADEKIDEYFNSNTLKEKINEGMQFQTYIDMLVDIENNGPNDLINKQYTISEIGPVFKGVGRNEKLAKLFVLNYKKQIIKSNRIIRDKSVIHFPKKVFIDYIYMINHYTKSKLCLNKIVGYFLQLSNVYIELLKYYYSNIFIKKKINAQFQIFMEEIELLDKLSNEYFVAFTSMERKQNNYRSLIKTTMLSMSRINNKITKRRTFTYSVNLRAAESVHIHIPLAYPGYRILDVTDSKKIFGRTITDDSLMSLNTRKKRILKPFFLYKNTLRYNLLMSIAEVDVKFGLKHFLNYLLLLTSFLLCITFLFASDPGILISGLLVPIISIGITAFAFDKWNITHYLMKPHKMAFLIFFVLFILKLLLVLAIGEKTIKYHFLYLGIKNDNLFVVYLKMIPFLLSKLFETVTINSIKLIDWGRSALCQIIMK